MPNEHPLSRSNFVKNILIIIVCLGIVPLAILSGARVPPHGMVTFIGVILAFQPFAASIGLVLGVPPKAIIGTMFSVGLGAIFFILTVCDLFSQRWERLAVAIQKVHAITKDSARFRRYGIVMFFPFIWVPGLGLYGCTLVAWLFEWRRMHHIVVLMAAWMAAVTIVMITSLELSFAIP